MCEQFAVARHKLVWRLGTLGESSLQLGCGCGCDGGVSRSVARSLEQTSRSTSSWSDPHPCGTTRPTPVSSTGARECRCSCRSGRAVLTCSYYPRGRSNGGGSPTHGRHPLHPTTRLRLRFNISHFLVSSILMYSREVNKQKIAGKK